MPQDVPVAANRLAEQTPLLSVLMLRVGAFWLALPTDVCREVAEIRAWHTLPHRPERLPLGLVNIRGALQLCFRLSQFLGLPQAQEAAALVNHTTYPRLVVIEYEAERWAVLVDELAGIERCSPDAWQHDTPTGTPAMRAVTRTCLRWHDTPVWCLDPERLCAVLRRELL